MNPSSSSLSEKSIKSGKLWFHLWSSETAIKNDCEITDQIKFGDSEGDSEMLDMSAHPFCIEPTKGLIEIATSKGWKVYDEDAAIVEDVTHALA